ncbi:MAG: XdhC family protein [Acidobacteria bacterium]|nr:XdhC family protein [Acidobacteriota bacterium]MBI3657746.1 XdhC family protein [Acidobacteriota bacterium]
MINIYEEIVRIRQRGERAALATIIGRKGSVPRKDAAKMLIRQDGSSLGTIGGGCTEAEVWREALNVMREEKAKTLSFELMEDEPTESGLLCGGTMEVYIEPILPDPVIYIFGAGHISQALCRVAKSVNFKIVVVDDRANYANPRRFPEADEIIVEEFEKSLANLTINDASYIIIVTRGHAYDQTILHWAVQTEARYIGLLGSRRKIKILYENLQAAGISGEKFDRVCGPIGLEIGSETPEEIAVSIAAELIAVRKNIDVQRLKQKKVYWHAQQPESVDE